MGIEALNCQCACEENPGESYIFDGVSDYYFPIKRKKSKIKIAKVNLLKLINLIGKLIHLFFLQIHLILLIKLENISFLIINFRYFHVK